MALKWDSGKYYIHRSLSNYLSRGIYYGQRTSQITEGGKGTGDWLEQIQAASNDIIAKALSKTVVVSEADLADLSKFGSEILSSNSQASPTTEVGLIQRKIEEEINRELNNSEKLLDKYSMRTDKMTGEITTKTMTADDDTRYNDFIAMKNELYKIQTAMGGSKGVTLANLQKYKTQIKDLATKYEKKLIAKNDFLADTRALLMQKRPVNGVDGDLSEVWKWMKLGLGYPATNLARGDIAEMVAAYAAQKLYATEQVTLQDFERIINKDPNMKVTMTGKDLTTKGFNKVIIKDGGITINDKAAINSPNKADIEIKINDHTTLGMSVKNVSFSGNKSPWVHLLDEGNLQNVLEPKLFFHLVQLHTSKANKLGGSMEGVTSARKKAYPYFKKVMLAQALIGTGQDAASILFVNTVNKKKGSNSVQAIHIPTLIMKMLEDDDLVTAKTSVQINQKYYTGNSVLFTPTYSKNKDPQTEMEQRVMAAVASAQDAVISHKIALSAIFM